MFNINARKFIVHEVPQMSTVTHAFDVDRARKENIETRGEEHGWTGAVLRSLKPLKTVFFI